MRNKAIASFLRACARAVCCLAVGVFVGALAFGAVSFFHVRAARLDAGFWETVDLAVDEGFLPFLLGGYPQDWLSHLARAVPAVLLALGAAYAWQAGLYQLGGAGQYALGAAAAIACASLHLQWYICLAAAALAGAAAGMIPGLLKARFHVHEALASALMNGLCIYGAQAAVRAMESEAGPWPDLRASMLILAGLACVLCVLKLRFRASGLDMRVLAAGEALARYAGLKTGGIIVSALLVSGLLGGLAGGAAYLLGNQEGLSLSLMFTGPGLHGLTAAALSGGRPVGAALLGFLIAHFSQGAQRLNGAVFPQETGEALLAVILYIASFLALPGSLKKGGK